MIYFLFKNKEEVFYFFIFALIISNIYNIYISWINKNDFKKKSDNIELNIEKIF